MERAAAVLRAVDDIDCPAAADEPVDPAFAPIGGAEEVGPLPAAAVDHDDRPFVPEVARNPVLVVLLAAHRLAGLRMVDHLAAGPEEALRGELQRACGARGVEVGGAVAAGHQ